MKTALSLLIAAHLALVAVPAVATEQPATTNVAATASKEDQRFEAIYEREWAWRVEAFGMAD